jgi:hypothetical protein
MEEYTPDYETVEEPKKRNTGLIIAIVVIALLLCCCCVALVSVLAIYGEDILRELDLASRFLLAG